MPNHSMQNRQKIYLFTAQSDRIKYLNSFGINQDDDLDILILNPNEASLTEIKPIENESK